MSEAPATLRIAMVLFKDMTQLELTGPYEIFARMPGAKVSLVSATLDPVRSERGLAILPDATYQELPEPDIVFVPGGPGQLQAMEDLALIAYLKKAAASARLTTSVCTGSLVLAAAGLLKGRKATCHWMAREQLAFFGAEPVEARVVEDGNVITGAGVTSGIDFALVVAKRLYGEDVAKEIQLQAEYDPDPPYAGSPAKAEAAVVERLRARGAALREKRLEAAKRLGAALS